MGTCIHFNFGTVRNRRRTYLALECRGGFQKLVKFVGWISYKPRALLLHFLFFLEISIIKNIKFP